MNGQKKISGGWASKLLKYERSHATTIERIRAHPSQVSEKYSKKYLETSISI